MAKVQQRVRSDGGTGYRVMWLLGGGRPRPGAAPGQPGSQASETFTDKKLMAAFKGAVEAQLHDGVRLPVVGEQAVYRSTAYVCADHILFCKLGSGPELR
jgi:hypothetical protein